MVTLSARAGVVVYSSEAAMTPLNTGDYTAMVEHDDHVGIVIGILEDAYDTAQRFEDRWEMNNVLHRLYRIDPDKYPAPDDEGLFLTPYDPAPTDREVYWCKYQSVLDCPDERMLTPEQNRLMAVYLFERIEDHWRLDGHYKKLGEMYPESFFLIPEYVSAHVRAYGERSEGTFAHYVWEAWEEAEGLSGRTVSPYLKRVFEDLFRSLPSS